MHVCIHRRTRAGVHRCIHRNIENISLEKYSSCIMATKSCKIIENYTFALWSFKGISENCHVYVYIRAYIQPSKLICSKTTYICISLHPRSFASCICNLTCCNRHMHVSLTTQDAQNAYTCMYTYAHTHIHMYIYISLLPRSCRVPQACVTLHAAIERVRLHHLCGLPRCPL